MVDEFKKIINEYQVTLLIQFRSPALLEHEVAQASYRTWLDPCTPDDIHLKALLAEHGLSCQIQVFSGSSNHTFLMDAGVSSSCLMHNAALLGIDLNTIDGVVLSHGHRIILVVSLMLSKPGRASLCIVIRTYILNAE